MIMDTDEMLAILCNCLFNSVLRVWRLTEVMMTKLDYSVPWRTCKDWTDQLIDLVCQWVNFNCVDLFLNKKSDRGCNIEKDKMLSPLIFFVVILPLWLLQKIECDYKQIPQYPYNYMELLSCSLALIYYDFPTQPEPKNSWHLRECDQINEISFEHLMETRGQGSSPIQAWIFQAYLSLRTA